MAIIQDKVDERIEQRVADMSDSVAEFDIQDHRDDIVNMIEEDVDFSDKMNEALSDVSFTTTID